MQHRFSWIDTSYNVGVTQFEQRYARATKPVAIGAFKPFSDGYERFKQQGLITKDLENIFKEHILI